MTASISSGRTAWLAGVVGQVVAAPTASEALERVASALAAVGADTHVDPDPGDGLDTTDLEHAVVGEHHLWWRWADDDAAEIVASLVAVARSRPAEADPLFAERRAALTHLTSGVAHEVNNPLAAVLANLELARRQVSERLKRRASYSWLDELHSELDDARLAADRIHQLVRQLRLFHRSRGGRDKSELRHAMDCVLQFQGRSLRARGRFHRSDPCDHLVDAPIHHVTHALFAAFSYLHEATPLGHRSEVQVTVSSRSEADEQVVVVLRYTGPSLQACPGGEQVASEAVDRVGGRLVSRHDGDDQLLELWMPAARPTPPSTPARQRTARVLVIDDEPLIGKAVRRMLGEHEVMVCTDGHDGLELAVRDRWDVVLVDMSLPPTSGRALYETLAERSPETARRVVFTSGGVTDPTVRDFLDSVPNELLAKPFDQARIRNLVRARL